MSEISFENVCRLCLKDSFLHANIFFDRSSHNSLIYEVLNFVYDLDISIGDGLSANICRPCLWKLREFEIYKINVHQAKSEQWNLKGRQRDNPIKQEVEEIVIRDEDNDNNDEIEREVYENPPDVPEEGMMIVKEENDVSTPQDRMEGFQIGDSWIMNKASEKVTSLAEERASWFEGPSSSGGRPTDKPNGTSSQVTSGSIPSEEVADDDGDFSESYREYESESCNQDSKRNVWPPRPAFSIMNVSGSRLLHNEHSVNGKYPDKVFETKPSWNIMHNRFVLQNGGSNFECSICRKMFGSQTLLKRHMKVHSLDKQFFCEFCDYKSVYLSNLKVHHRVHTGETYKCPFCPVSYRAYQTILKHKRLMHAEELRKLNPHVYEPSMR